MRHHAAKLRRLATSATALTLCAAVAITSATPTATAASGRELLAAAIANTRGSYLVYNFGGGHPAPMLNAAGSWYEMASGGRLMIIKGASSRLTPRTRQADHRDQRQLLRHPRAERRFVEDHRERSHNRCGA